MVIQGMKAAPNTTVITKDEITWGLRILDTESASSLKMEHSLLVRFHIRSRHASCLKYRINDVRKSKPQETKNNNRYQHSDHINVP